jgi:hypothetical protein
MCTRLFQISLLVFLTRRCFTFPCHGNKFFFLTFGAMFFFFNRALVIITLFSTHSMQYIRLYLCCGEYYHMLLPYIKVFKE